MRWVGFVYTEVYSLVGLALFATHNSPFLKGKWDYRWQECEKEEIKKIGSAGM